MKKLNTNIKTEKVEIDGMVCTISGMTGDQRDDHNDLVRSKMVKTGETDEKGNDVYTLSTVKGINKSIVLATLRDDKGKPFKEEVVALWPSDVIEYVAERGKKLSGLDSASGEDSKND